jgi:hypothetical protein
MTCKACLLGRGEHDHALKPCTGCAWTSKKWTFLGPKQYCRLYKSLRDVRCVDWKRRKVTTAAC